MRILHTRTHILIRETFIDGQIFWFWGFCCFHLDGFAHSAVTEGMDAGRDQGSACACARLRVFVVEAYFKFDHVQSHSINKIVLRAVVQKRPRRAAKAQTICFAMTCGQMQLRTLPLWSGAQGGRGLQMYICASA